jgi:hypothetical protein
MHNILLSAFVALITVTVRAFFMVLPSILVLIALSTSLYGDRGASVLTATHHDQIHELFPNSSWNDLAPCGLYFNEQEEFRTARSCVNKNVWESRPLTINEKDFPIPRCYIIKAHSPNVLSKDGINFLPIFDPSGVGAVVGVYQPETRTVFVVENVDAPMVYRHELQHYFLHEHDPITEGGGHDQEIWSKCEPPYYTPSDKAVALGKGEATPVATPTPESSSRQDRVDVPKPNKYVF